ncbi:MAG: hypothetical protein AB7N76_19035 [Planctomycetota bacterium]
MSDELRALAEDLERLADSLLAEARLPELLAELEREAGDLTELGDLPRVAADLERLARGGALRGARGCP